MTFDARRSDFKSLERLPNLSSLFFPNTRVIGEEALMTVRVGSLDASVRDFVAYLTLLDRVHGRLFPSGLRSYSRRPEEHLKIYEARGGSLELEIVKILPNSFQATILIVVYLFMKHLPRLIEVSAKAYRDFQEGRLIGMQREELKKEKYTQDQSHAEDEETKMKVKKEVIDVMPEIASKEPALKNLPNEIIREVGNTLGEIAAYDMSLQQIANRFAIEHEVEIKINFSPRPEAQKK